MGGRMGQGGDRVGGSVGVWLDAALVGIVLETVLHVRDGLGRDKPGHGVMGESKEGERSAEVEVEMEVGMGMGMRSRLRLTIDGQ